MTTQSELKNETLFSIVERSVFNLDKLKEFKKMMLEFDLPESEIPRIMEATLMYLDKVFRSLEKNLPFYIEHFWTSEELNDYGNKEEDDDVEIKEIKESFRQQLRERDELLVQLKERITKIHKKIISE